MFDYRMVHHDSYESVFFIQRCVSKPVAPPRFNLKMIPIFKSTVFKGSPVFMVKCLTNPTKYPKTVPMNIPIVHNIIIIIQLNQLTLNPYCWCICKPCLNPPCFMIKFYYHGDYSYMISHIIPLLSSFLVIFGGWNLHFFSAKKTGPTSAIRSQTPRPQALEDLGISDIVEWSFWITLKQIDLIRRYHGEVC